MSFEMEQMDEKNPYSLRVTRETTLIEEVLLRKKVLKTESE